MAAVVLFGWRGRDGEFTFIALVSHSEIQAKRCSAIFNMWFPRLPCVLTSRIRNCVRRYEKFPWARPGSAKHHFYLYSIGYNSVTRSHGDANRMGTGIPGLGNFVPATTHTIKEDRMPWVFCLSLSFPRKHTFRQAFLNVLFGKWRNKG